VLTFDLFHFELDDFIYTFLICRIFLPKPFNQFNENLANDLQFLQQFLFEKCSAFNLIKKRNEEGVKVASPIRPLAHSDRK
jgi:hypothetical protein